MLSGCLGPQYPYKVNQFLENKPSLRQIRIFVRSHLCAALYCDRDRRDTDRREVVRSAAEYGSEADSRIARPEGVRPKTSFCIAGFDVSSVLRIISISIMQVLLLQFRIFFTLILLSLAVQVFSQAHHVLRMSDADSLDLALLDLHAKRFSSADSIKVWIQRVRNRGYLTASVDRIQSSDSLIAYRFDLGPVFRWVAIRNHNIDPYILKLAKVDLKSFTDSFVKLYEYRNTIDKLLAAYQNSGYPYAEITSRVLGVRSEKIEMSLSVDRGVLVRYGEMQVEEPAKISNKFLASYLGVQQGKAYSQTRLNQIPEKIKHLSYLTLVGNPTTRFSHDIALIQLPVETKPAGQFDFILGFQPNSNSGIDFTGRFLGDFVNQFGRGERLYVKLDKLQAQSQQMELALNLPYMFMDAIGVKGAFDLYRRDSSFVNIGAELGLAYYFGGIHHVTLYWSHKATNVTTTDYQSILNGSPSDLDTRFSNIRLSIFWNNLDDMQNPTEGISVQLSSSVGRRRILINPEIDEQIPQVYQNLELSTLQLQTKGAIRYYIPLAKRTVLLAQMRGAYIGPSALFRNELYRIGGAKILRGFDDESIFASAYALFTTEYRYLFGENRYFFLFADYARLREMQNQALQNTYALGFGAGMRFKTAGGIFSLSYALGMNRQQSIRPNQAKIHFGYISFF